MTTDLIQNDRIWQIKLIQTIVENNVSLSYDPLHIYNRRKARWLAPLEAPLPWSDLITYSRTRPITRIIFWPSSFGTVWEIRKKRVFSGLEMDFEDLAITLVCGRLQSFSALPSTRIRSLLNFPFPFDTFQMFVYGYVGDFRKYKDVSSERSR